MCAERHMIYPDATEIWHDVDFLAHPDRVCFPRLKHQEIMFGVSGEEYSVGRKPDRGLECISVLHILFLQR